jgi:hypothetical protein
MYLNRRGHYSLSSMSRVENVASHGAACGTRPARAVTNGKGDQSMSTNGRNGSAAFEAWPAATPEISMTGLVVSEPREEAPAQGERRLLIALLEDAVRCYQKYAFSGTRRGRRLFREADAWFTDPDLDVDIRFEFVCDVLGIEADSVRDALRRWRAGHFTGATVATGSCQRYGDATGGPRPLWTVVTETTRLRRRPETTAPRMAASG